MREIKFRAWNIERKCWYPIDDVDEFGILNDPEFIVEQFTGLRDKNGREIYEGDVIQARDRNSNTIFTEMKCCWREDRFYFESSGVYRDFLDMLNHEVVGNIHERGMSNEI